METFLHLKDDHSIKQTMLAVWRSGLLEVWVDGTLSFVNNFCISEQNKPSNNAHVKERISEGTSAHREQ